MLDIDRIMSTVYIICTEEVLSIIYQVCNM